MSYGLKYFARYKTNDGVLKEMRFSKVDYSGETKEWFVTKGSVNVDQGASDNLFGNRIVTSQKKLGLWFTEKYDLSEFVFNRKTFFCEIIVVESGHVEWSGWVEPWNAAHEYKDAPYAVSLTASCGLAHLSRKKYANPNSAFMKTGLTLIKECLAIIESDLPLRVSTHMKENSFSGVSFNGLQSYEINTARYYDDNGEALYCDVILSDILEKFNAELTQWDNRWVVRADVDHATGFETSYIEYAPDGSYLPTTTPWPETYTINDTEAFTVQGGQISVLAPINKYRTEVDLGPQKPFFENGNLVLWTDDGLVGWDFSHMPKGNPGWERFFLGQEGSTASVLKINGRAPEPLRKKKKKKWGLIIALIATGANPLGAQILAAKNKYTELEPAEWIEAPLGKLSRGDKDLTVSFEYETAPNSSDVLISIRLHSSWNTTVKDRYLNTALGDSNTETDFHLIKVPPVEREGLLYVGALDVSGNPNYPNGAVENYTFIARGVPAGQVRRIGGPLGIIVENDDLIIVKHTNPGGTQAAVGNYWQVINIRNNVKKGTYSVTIPVDRNNIVSASHEKDPLLYDEVFIRFYKIRTDPGGIGDWYKIYKLNGNLEGFVASSESSKYATTLERGAPTDEEAETINLITGDYNPYFSGALMKPGTDENTSSWSRRSNLSESLSIYRAMMLDRLCLTSRPLTVAEGEIYIFPGEPEISYFHTIVLADKDNMRLKIVRYSYNDIQRIVKFTAVEVKYEEIPPSELRQDSYIPGQGALNVIPGQGDGYYPTKTDSATERVSAEDLPLTSDELEDLSLSAASARQSVVFSDIDPLVYVVGTQSTASVDLIDYVSEQFSEINDDQEDEDKFDLTTLVLSVIDKPVWVSEVSFDSLEVSVTAKAQLAGNYYITLNALEPESEQSIEFKLPIEAINKTVITTNLIDATDETTIGALPGFYLNPEKIDIWPRVKGNHNLVVLDLIGGGPDGEALNEHREFPTNYLVTDFTYKMFLAMAGIIAPVGIYTFRVRSYFEGALRSDTTVPFTLYDEEFLAKLSAELWDTTKGQVLGVIEPDGSSKFKAPVSFDPKSIISDLEHDKIVFSLAVDGVSVITDKEYTQADPVTEAEYDLFGEITTEYGPAKYDMLVDIYLGSDQVYQRLVSWEIIAKEVLPQAGIQLISFTENTVNYEVLADLPMSNSEFDLPDAYGFKIPVPAVDFDHQEWKAYDKTSGSLLPIDIETYTNKPQYVDYAEGETPEDILVFDLKNSTQIGRLHRAPSAVRVVSIFKKGGAAGDIVAIVQADVSFRVPLNPEDYSGLRFITFDADTSVQEVTDANMPISGRTYILPVYPKYWSVAARSYNGQLFDEVTLELKKDGVFLHSLAGAYVSRFTSSTPVTELEDDLSASIFGYPSDDERRYLINPSGEQVLIDDLGEVQVIATFKLAGALVGVLDTTFIFADAEEDLPIVDFEEVDPTVPQWVKDITEADIENWNNLSDNGHYVSLNPINGNPSDSLNSFDLNSVINSSSFHVINPINGPFANYGFINTIAVNDNAFFQTAFSELDQDSFSYRLKSSGTVYPWFRVASRSWVDMNYMSYTNFIPYFDARFNIDFAAKTTDALTEGSGHLYYTDARVNALLVNYVPKTRTIIAGTGLTGGGDLSANRTISFDTAFGDARYLTGSAAKYVSLNPASGFASDDIASLDLNGISKTSSAHITALTNGPFSGYGFVSTIALGTSAFFQTAFSQLDSDSFFYRGKSSNTVFAWNQVASRSWTDANYLSFANFNTYFDARFNVDFAGKNTNALTEGSGNLYFTEARVRATPLTGFSVGSASSILATDSILGAFGKVQALLNAKAASGTTLSDYGITDAYTKTQSDANYFPSVITVTDFNSVTGYKILRGGSGTITNQPLSGYWGQGWQVSTDNNSSNINQLVFDIAGNLYTRTKAGIWGIWSTVATQEWVNVTFVPLTRTVSVGTGLTGGGVLSSNISLAFDTVFGDARYALFSHTHTFASLTSKPTTLAGYGITDAVTSGSISGTSGYIPRYTSGNTLGNSIMSDDGSNVTIAGGLISNAAIFKLSASSSGFTAFSLQTSNITKWGIGITGTESGSNAGSDFWIYSVTDGGGFLRDQLRISRDTGRSVFGGTVAGSDPVAINDYTTKSYVDWLLAGKASVSHTHTAGDITNFTASVRTSVSGGTGISYNNSSGVISLDSHTHTSGDITDFTSAVRTSVSAGTGISYNNSTGVISLAAHTHTSGDITDFTGAVRTSISGGSGINYNNSTGVISLGSHSHVASDITDFVASVRTNISAGSNITYNNSTGVISLTSGNIISALGYTPEQNNRTITINGNTQNIKDNPNFTITSSGGTITGGGTANYITKWSGGNSITNSRIYDYGSGWLNLPETYVQGDLLADGYTFLNIVGIGGTSGNDASAILQINSTTKGFLGPRMTYAQRMAISSPAVGLQVFQTDVSGSSPVGLKVHVGSGVWTKNTVTFD